MVYINLTRKEQFEYYLIVFPFPDKEKIENTLIVLKAMDFPVLNKFLYLEEKDIDFNKEYAIHYSFKSFNYFEYNHFYHKQGAMLYYEEFIEQAKKFLDDKNFNWDDIQSNKEYVISKYKDKLSERILNAKEIENPYCFKISERTVDKDGYISIQEIINLVDNKYFEYRLPNSYFYAISRLLLCFKDNPIKSLEQCKEYIDYVIEDLKE